MKEYIEKDAALEATYEPFTMSMCMTVPECNGMNRAREMIFKQLRAIPAADVVEVKHAKDVYKQYTEHHCEFMCSLCGRWIGVIEGGDCDFNYCPNCGAKMEV